MLFRLLAIFAVLWLVGKVVRRIVVRPHHHPTRPSPLPLVQDPVCGLYIDPQAAPKSVRLGEKTVYFCSDQCADAFLSKKDSLTVDAYDRAQK